VFSSGRYPCVANPWFAFAGSEERRADEWREAKLNILANNGGVHSPALA